MNRLSRTGEHPDIVGREHELNLLGHALKAVWDGHGRLVLVSGEAGIGKTTLVQALVRQASKRGALVLAGAAYDLSATPPYGPWLELFERYQPSGELPELPKVLQRGTGVGDVPNQVALFEVALEFFVEISKTLPLVLALEDLHWSDQASLNGLRHIARKIGDHRVLIIATYRDEEITPRHPLFQLLPALVREARTDRIDLRRLDASAVSRLIDSEYELATCDRDTLVKYLMEWSEGNPLFADELLRTLNREGMVRQTGTGWQLADLSDAPVPSLVQQLIESRLESLDESSVSAIREAAVIGQKVPLGIWEPLTGSTVLTTAIEDAMAAGLVRQTNDPPGIAFRHALVRAAIYATIPLHKRRSLHRELAELFLNQSRQDAEAVSYHLKQAGDGRAVEWLIRAGEHAERTFAWKEAFIRYNEALHVLYEIPGSESTIAGLMLKMARLLRFLDPARAEGYLHAARRLALECDEHTIAAAAQFNIGTNLCNLGDFSRGLREMAEAVEILSNDPDEATQIIRWSQTSLSAQADPIQAWLGSLTMNLSTAGRFQEAIETGERSLRTSWDDIRNPKVVAQLSEYTHSALDAFEGIGVAMAALGQPADAEIAFDFSQKIHRKLNYGPSRVIVSSLELLMNHFPYRTTNLHERVRLIKVIEDHLQISSGMVGNQNSLWGYEHYLVYSGRWNELRELIRSGITPTLVEYQFVSLSARARLHWYEGNQQNAWEILNKILKNGSKSAPEQHLFIVPAEPLRIAAGLALDAGDRGLAREWMTAHDTWLDWSGAVLGLSEAALLRARYYELNGDIVQAKRNAEGSLELASAPRQPLALIAVYRFLGELSTKMGKLQDAESYLEQSWSLAKACATPFERALTRLAQAELQIVLDNHSKARELLAEVHKICADLGARPTLDRAEKLMAELEPRRIEHSSGLTRRELEVLQLLAQGKSDREVADELFISYRTVTNHVASILRKLNVDSRTAAATQAVRNNLV